MREGDRTKKDLTKTVLSIILTMSLSVMVTPQISGPEPADTGSWRIETVDTLDDVGLYSSITLDDNNNPHISYSESGYWDLKYAYWDSSSWVNEFVDSTGDAGGSNSIALDSNDYPHISYRVASPNYDLRYAKWNGNSWTIETVDFFGNTGSWTSLSLDSNGYPHISFWNNGNGEVKYAKWNGSAWSIEIVDSPGHAGSGTSLALDSNDYPHISYSAHGQLHYAKWNGSAWSIDIVDADPSIGAHNSIALDSNDYPHVSYNDGKNQYLRYARWNGSMWSLGNVDSTGVTGHDSSSLDLDSNDYPHISYEANGNLRYARWDGSTWNFEVVDSECNIGDRSQMSIIVDGRDIPHISYYDHTNQNLKYATKAESTLTPPLPPTSLRTTVENPLNVRLDWIASESPGVTHYLIYRSEDHMDFDFSTPLYNTSSDVHPLRANWTDIGAASMVAPSEYYYVVRVVNDQGLRSITGNTAGKWTKTFNKGLSAFSLPLEPFDIRNVGWYADNIPNVDFIRWANSTGHWVTHNPSMAIGVNDVQIIMGDAYEMSSSSSANFTFCGYPASMIRFHEGLGDSVTFRRSLSVQVEGNGVNLSWESVPGASKYLIFRSERRNGLHNLSVSPIANTTDTMWKDLGVVENVGEYYYTVIPEDSQVELGSSTYSVGVITLDYNSGSDTFALPLKPVETRSVDWYCDHIPSVEGMVYLILEMWKFHAREMPKGVYDVQVLQAEGYQISANGTTRFTFIGY